MLSRRAVNVALAGATARYSANPARSCASVVSTALPCTRVAARSAPIATQALAVRDTCGSGVTLPGARRTFATRRTSVAHAAGKPDKPARGGDKPKPARGKKSDGVAGQSASKSEVGAPAEGWVEDDHWPRLAEPHTVSVIGAPMQYGQGLDGSDMAPGAFRDKGLLKDITLLGWRVRDRGDVDIVSPSLSDPRGESQPRHSYAVGVSNQRLGRLAYQSATDGHFTLTLGGDHCVAIGSLGGALKARPSLGVVWVDAHADINAPEFSPSSNAHGMPVAFLTRLIEAAKIPGYEWMDTVPKLDPEKIVYIGLRDLDDFEKGLIRKLGIKTFTMQHIDKHGIGKVMEMSMDHLAGKKQIPLHMSFDIDGCDPTIAPATGTRVPGGLNFRESSYVCEAVAETGLLVSMDMVEVNPLIGGQKAADTTLDLASGLIKCALGDYIL